MRLHVVGALVLGVALLAAPVSADVRITIANGTVTVSAKDATVRQILAEWARVGQTRIVNAERVSGPPMSLELTNVPEAQALDIVLRTISGYLAAPRAVALPNASSYDRIYLLPTSTGAPARGATPPQPSQPAFIPNPLEPDLQPPDEEVPRPPAPNQGQPNAPRGPIFNTFPQPPPAQRQTTPLPAPEAPVSSPSPVVPAGVATPGMVIPAPPQPGQQPGQQPGRPPDL